MKLLSMTKAERLEIFLLNGGRGTDVELAPLLDTSRHGIRSFVSAINARKPGSIIMKSVSGQRKKIYEHRNPIRVPDRPVTKKIVSKSAPKHLTVTIEGHTYNCYLKD